MNRYSLYLIPKTRKPTHPARLFVVLLALAAATARSQEIVNVKVGINGIYKVGLWTPIEVTLRGGKADIEVRVFATTQDNDGFPCDVPATETCQLSPEETTKVTLYSRFSSLSPTLQVRLEARDRLVAQWSFSTRGTLKDERLSEPLAPGQRLIVQVGGSATGLEEAAAISKISVAGSDTPLPRTATVRIDSLYQLPARLCGYEAVEAVIIATSDAKVFEFSLLTSQQLDALDAWVHSGGKLVLSVGTQAAKTLAHGTPLSRFSPGKFERTLSLGKTAAWETYAKSPNSVPRDRDGKVNIVVAQLADVRGKVECVESDLPLVIRTPRGLGQVVFVAADLDIGPLSLWTDRRLLVATLLDMPANVASTDENNTNRNRSYSDLAGQLCYSIDDFSRVSTVPFSAVAITIIIYILMIGPGDYFLLRRFTALHRTWITFPATVVAFCVGAYFVAYAFKGREIHVNEIDLIDVDADGATRGTTWLNLLSPKNDTYDLSLKPRLVGGESPLSTTATLGWLGMAGDGLGGMYRNDLGAQGQLSSQPYSMTPDLTAIVAAPIQVWSTKSFVARWNTPQAARSIDSNLVTDEAGLPFGRITNRSTVALEQCFLAHERWLYSVGTLSPGASIEIGGTTRRIGIEALFGSQAGANSEIVHRDETFEPDSRSPSQVLAAMMFYEVADGLKHTGLGNNYQSFVDLSDVLKTGQAVLVARPKIDASYLGPELDRDGMPLTNAIDRRTVIYRFVLPVIEKSVGH